MILSEGPHNSKLCGRSQRSFNHALVISIVPSPTRLPSFFPPFSSAPPLSLPCSVSVVVVAEDNGFGHNCNFVIVFPVSVIVAIQCRPTRSGGDDASFVPCCLLQIVVVIVDPSSPTCPYVRPGGEPIVSARSSWPALDGNNDGDGEDDDKIVAVAEPIVFSDNDDGDGDGEDDCARGR